MKNFLKFGFAFALIFIHAGNLSAYNPIINEVEIPYEVSVIRDGIEQRKEYLGELNGDPHMYEFALASGTTLTLFLQQKEEKTETIPLSLIVVKQNEDGGGVTEVGRLYKDNILWEPVNDKTLGIRFLQSNAFTTDIGPGIYRIEVSSPDNYGKYVLVIGEEGSNVGYFKKISVIHTYHTFFGGSIFSMIRSHYVLYTLVVIFILIFGYRVWSKRRLLEKFKNA